MPERNPLDLLQDAWQQVGAPEAVKSLEEEDPLTQNAVLWMQEAWAQVEVPLAVLPSARKPWLRLRPLTLTAAALLIGALFFWNTQLPLQKNITPNEIVVAVPAQVSAPQLLANTTEHLQIRSGNVRLTMLRSSNASSTPDSTDS